MRTAADIRINKVFDFDFSILQAHHVLHPLTTTTHPPSFPQSNALPLSAIITRAGIFPAHTAMNTNIYDPNKQNQKNFPSSLIPCRLIAFT